MRKQQGFTLIEIAIVLVIIGLLLGGVLKGQELINAARVRNIASQLDGVKVAYLGFQDRYRAYPGDVGDAQAAAQIPNATVGCGTAGTGFCGNGKIDPAENLVAWSHLSKSGFISGSYNGVVGTTQATFQTPTTADAPSNPFGGFMAIVHDQDYGDGVTTTPANVLNIKTGGSIPATTIAELDRKVDDGLAYSGQFRTTITYGSQAAGCTTGTNGTNTLAYANIDIKACGGTAIQ